MVALLQDFLRAVGLEGPSVTSVCLFSLSISDWPSPASGVDVVGAMVRRDLFGGTVLGLVDERLFDVDVSELPL